MTVDDPPIQNQLNQLDQILPRRHHQHDERRCVLPVFYGLHSYSRKRLDNCSFNATCRTAKLFSISTNTGIRLMTTYTKAFRQHSNKEEHSSSALPSNSSSGSKIAKPRWITVGNVEFFQVRDFLNFKRNTCSHVCTLQILNFTIKENIISISSQEDKLHEKAYYDSDIKSVQYYLSRKGF